MSDSWELMNNFTIPRDDVIIGMLQFQIFLYIILLRHPKNNLLEFMN